MKALVTGGTGFVGAAVARALLRAGWQVRALVRPSSDSPQSARSGRGTRQGTSATRHRSSAPRPAARRCFMWRPTIAWAHPIPQELYRTNVEGTRNILRGRAQRPASSASSTPAASPPSAFQPTARPATRARRSTLADMIGHYKRSKFLAEARGARGRTRGTPVVIVNPSTPVGPGDVKPTPTGQMVLDAAAGRMPAYVDTGLNIVHVDDVAARPSARLQRGRAGERYILGGQDMSLREILARSRASPAASPRASACHRRRTADRLHRGARGSRHRRPNASRSRAYAWRASACSSRATRPAGARLSLEAAHAGVRGRRAAGFASRGCCRKMRQRDCASNGSWPNLPSQPAPATQRPWDARLARRLVTPLKDSRSTPNHLTTVRLGVRHRGGGGLTAGHLWLDEPRRAAADRVEFPRPHRRRAGPHQRQEQPHRTLCTTSRAMPRSRSCCSWRWAWASGVRSRRSLLGVRRLCSARSPASRSR